MVYLTFQTVAAHLLAALQWEAFTLPPTLLEVSLWIFAYSNLISFEKEL
jgi:hypothetical protein